MKIAPKKILCTILAAAAVFAHSMPLVYAHEDEEETETVQTAAPELYEGDTFTDNVLTYNKAKGGVYITACDSNTTAVNIGEKIDGYKILGIYDNAFAGCNKLRSASIADGVSYLGEGAFLGCEKLETVKLPDGITEIPAQCFAQCTSLKEIEIPESVTSVGSYAFSYCDSLGDIELPSTVTSVGDYSFAFSSLGESLELWEGLETLGAMSFYYCRGVKTVSIPSTLESVGSLSFLGCEDLENFVVSEKSEYFKAIDGVLYSKDETILEVFPMGKNVTEFAVPESVLYIPSGAFFDNPYLETITMADSVEAIGEAAFSNCTALRSITLSNKLTEIGGSLFCDCSSLSSIEIPASVGSIGDYAFLECTSLKTVTVPDTVEAIGEYALGFTDDEEGEFHKLDGFKLKANFDTAAKDYAKSNRISIEYLDENKDLPYIIAICAVVGIIVIGIAVAVIVIIRKKKKTDEFYQK